MEVFVECLKGTKEKYEITPDKKALVVDRMLKRKWAASYGFVPGTLQADHDELDAYVIGKKLQRGKTYDVMPICLVYTIDNGEADNKLICAHESAGKWFIRAKVRQIVHFIKKYKKGSYPVKIAWDDFSIRFEYAKCKAYSKQFRR